MRKLSKELNNKLAYQITHEPLTSLPNRYALLEALNKKQHYGLALINIDGFKEINDFYGHDFGDKVLLALSQLIKQIIKTNPLDLYKMPSDEFAIALSKPLSSNELNEIFKNISTLMQTHSYNIENISLYVTYSIGVCIDDKLSYELLSNADIALKTAKKQNTNLVYYSDELQAKKDYQNNILWSKKLKDAISKNRFKIFYQPIFNAKTHKILKYEALIRMVDEDGSIVAPYIFLPAAKKTRLYPHITKFIIDGIFEKLEQTNYTFSINISILDILNLKTTEYIFSKLASSKHSNRVIFELLESEGVENYNEVIDFISKIKSYGARVAIDDFGTGYSNFAHIIKLNINILKIDGSLIKNIDTDKNAQTIVTSIVEFSKQLDIEVVAEFVHSKEVLDKCVELGISHLQGFYLAQPQELN